MENLILNKTNRVEAYGIQKGFVIIEFKLSCLSIR